jgi:hypothetical protein
MNWVMEVLQSMGVPNDVLGWVIVLVDVAVKSIVILGVAAAVTLGLRGASAALRHHVWAAALGGLLLLPLLSIVLPQWQVSLLPSPFQPPDPTPCVRRRRCRLLRAGASGRDGRRPPRSRCRR